MQLPNPNQQEPAANEPGPDAPVTAAAPAPSTTANFEGLDFQTWGAGHPPDTNGDVGPDYYIQSINSSLGIYDKTTGARVAAFTLDTFMSQGNFGNLCDTDNFGDPVVLYDTFEDRWVISDFAFQVDGSGNVVNPPGAFECFAVSKSGDPLAGGWNFYSINTAGGLGDYPKLGIWPDGIYMSVNMFDYAASGSFQNVRVYAFNKAQMYAGAPSVQSVEFDLPSSEFTLLPANARLQTGTPASGSPNYFASIWNYLNVVSVWKFHVDWNSISLSTLTGPFNSLTATNWSQLTSLTAPSPGNRLDTLYPRLMMQNQYSNIGGIESLWNAHTAGASGTTSSQAAVRYYEVRVTGGTVAANATQAFTYSPDTALSRFMPSLAVDRAGNMAIGYSTSSLSAFPAIKYAGRLAGDPANSITQTETSLINGTGTQSGSCGGTCERWGDYSTMTLDPNGCTFWYTNEYYQTTGLNHRTRIGAFSFPACTPIGAGTLQGTVRTAALAPIAGATVMLGSRSTTTDNGGNYSFTDLPAGTYPSVTASFPGASSATFTSIVVNSLSTTTRDFVLTTAPLSGCFTDTTQSDFLGGTATNCDASASAGDLRLAKPLTIDQRNLTVTSNGFGFSSTAWVAQTFVPAVTGTLKRVDLDLFCSGCTGTTPNITVSIRATNGTSPVGADLATATIPGFSSGGGGFFSAVFAAPPTLTAGTRYAIVFRAVANPSPGTYAFVCSCSPNSNPYGGGRIFTSSSSGNSWSPDNTSGGRDLGFITYMEGGFAASGTFVSSTKDANPEFKRAPVWGNLSWNATTPAGTAVQFQVAGSNSPNGPFNFVGPNGTASTFFSNGASLAQFNGFRYLKYKVVLSTTNSSVTPALHEVSICFENGIRVDDETVTLAVASGGTRLQQLQNADGGWYFRATDTSCGATAGVSCENIIGVTGLGLISAYERSNNDASILADAIAAGDLMISLHNANPSQRPYSQDLEFLVALSGASSDPSYATTAAAWFATITAQYPNPADRVDADFARRNSQGLRTLAVWDVASTIRAAKAAGQVSYAVGLANRVVAREAEWKDVNVLHRWDQCGVASGCGPADNKRAFDYTLLGMGSMLWAIHDLPGFDSTIASYRSHLLAQQDATGSWDVGDLQITSYAGLGLGAVGGTGTSEAIHKAIAFFIEHQLPNSGFPFSFVNGVAGNEYSVVDSEVIRAIDVAFSTQAGVNVQVTPAQLANVTFTEVTQPGSTTVVASASSGTLPDGYTIVPGLTYTVSTTAVTGGTSTVCFSAALAGGGDARILHREGNRFVDRTAAPNCAEVDTLDAFAIATIDPSCKVMPDGAKKVVNCPPRRQEER
ncbi:MAG TPA: carboxypeptidase-like regulatory domain-containing protein [Vicinamibacterales bacterium]